MLLKKDKKNPMMTGSSINADAILFTYSYILA
jgi:hypothetical protein